MVRPQLESEAFHRAVGSGRDDLVKDLGGEGFVDREVDQRVAHPFGIALWLETERKPAVFVRSWVGSS